MKKMINKTHIEGLVYENELKLNVAGPTAKNPGMEYINGKINILTGEENIVTVNMYEAALTSKGATNTKFATAKSLLNAKTVMTDGAELATSVKIDSAVSLNEWYKGEELVSTPQNFGGFIHIVPKAVPSATFETDMVIVRTAPEMKKSDTNPDEMVETGRLNVHGYIFDFMGSILPVRYVVENPNGITFFEAMEPNTFTKVWGNQVSSVFKSTKVEESAFGDSKVFESEFTRKEWIITGTTKEPYTDETMLTPQELQDAMANRNIKLAGIKQRQAERQAATPTPVSNSLAAVNAGGFSF